MKKRKFLSAVLIALSLLAVISVFYLNRPGAQAQSRAQAAMQSSSAAEVSTSNWITFTPVDTVAKVGFIFYPGGKVEAQAYAPVLHEIAAQGFLVVNVPMPFDLAVFGSNKAEEVIEAFPEIETWVIGGHSLGGVMAAGFALDNPDQIDGLALWASYPAEGASLAESSLAVISIFATLDGLSTPEKIAASTPLLPPDTLWVPIEGGNHAQFGDYGVQSGDLVAIISPTDQQAQIVDAMIGFLSELAP